MFKAQVLFILILSLVLVSLTVSCNTKERQIVTLPKQLSSLQLNTVKRELEQNEYKIIQEFQSVGMIVVCAPEEQTKLLSSDYFRRRNALYETMEIEPDKEVSAADSQGSWALDRIDQPNLPLDRYRFDPRNCSTHLARAVDMFVIDTGCRTTHKEFSGAQITALPAPGSRFPNGRDRNGHGTAVAALLVGRSTGAAPRANVTCVKAMNDKGSGLFSNVISALSLAASASSSSVGRGTFAVLSLAAYASQSFKAMDTAVERAAELGVVIFAAAGNDGKDACDYTPSRQSDALSVAATDSKDRLAKFSNAGSCVDAVAPGRSVLSATARHDSAYKKWDGTSFATPLVAAVIALSWDGTLSKEGLSQVARARSLISELSQGRRAGYPMPTLDGTCHSAETYSTLCWKTVLAGCACACVLIGGGCAIGALGMGIRRKRRRRKVGDVNICDEETRDVECCTEGTDCGEEDEHNGDARGTQADLQRG